MRLRAYDCISKSWTYEIKITGITAKVLYDYAATCDGELTLTEGETITITSKATGSPDWWEGKGSHGKGQFPSAYVQEEPQQATAGLSSPTRGKTVSAKPPSFQAKAIYDYTAVTPEELSIAEGDVIKVTDALDSDWWTGEVDGRSGTFPANYVERL